MNSKFFAAVSAALVCAATAFADESRGISDDQSADLEARRSTPCQIGIADPLVIPGMGYDVAGLRFSLFYGSSRSLAGLDLGLVGLIREDMSGLSLGGFNWVDGKVRGVQLGLLGNVDGFDMSGVQFALGFNSCRSGATGLQVSLVNCAGNIQGVQIGAVNWDNSYSTGLQLGLANVDGSEFHGASAALVNCTESFYGLQFGALNVATKTGCGVQFGLFNAADRFTGLQIGLLNLIGNAPIPVLPVVNANF